MRCSQVALALLMTIVGSAMMAGGSAAGRSDLSAGLGLDSLPYFADQPSEELGCLAAVSDEVGSSDGTAAIDFQSSFPLESVRQSDEIVMDVETYYEGYGYRYVPSTRTWGVESQRPMPESTPSFVADIPTVDELPAATTTEVWEPATIETPAPAIPEAEASIAAAPIDEENAASAAQSEAATSAQTDVPAEQKAMTKYEYYLRYMGQLDQETLEATDTQTAIPTEAPQLPVEQDDVSGQEPAESGDVASTYQYDYTYDDFIMEDAIPAPTVVTSAPSQADATKEVATTETAASGSDSASAYSFDKWHDYPWDGDYQATLKDYDQESDTYHVSSWNARIASIGDLSTHTPSELLSASDYALLKTLARSQEEPVEVRHQMVEEHIATLGWRGLEFASQFEASSQQDIGELADDLPMMAALLAGFRFCERGEMTPTESVEMLRNNLGNLPQSWTDAVQEIVNEAMGVRLPSGDSAAMQSFEDGAADQGLLRVVTALAETSWQSVNAAFLQGIGALENWKTGMLAEASRLRTR